MGKTTRRTNKRVTDNNETMDSPVNQILQTRHRLKCKNIKQKEFANLITEKEIVISAGPAGVGKSYVAIARAIELLQNKTNPYQKLIISKPAIEADEKHGFLPGDMKDKMEPYIKSSVDIIYKIIGKSNRVKLEEMDVIVVEALAYIRGSSIDNSILVMEEVQNMSPKQVKTLLTRIGENTKFILSGDLDQSDRFKNVKDSGLYDAMNRHKNVEEIGFFEFDKDDIVRNPIISKILKNYDTIENNVPTPTINVKDIRQKPVYGKPKKKQTKILRKIKIFFKKNFKI